MPRETLDRQIHHLQNEVLLLGSMVEQANLEAVDALKRRDNAAARQLYDNDRLINEKRYALENAILILMATQQPMARDLRLMAAFLEVITELERMGDYAKGVAKITMRLGDSPLLINSMRDFSQMVDIGVSMLHRALSAFIAEDAQQAHDIPNEDQQVDALYNHIRIDMVNSMLRDPNPSTIEDANLLMWVAHNLERLADRVTNICERTVFIVTGEMMEMDTTDDEESDA